MYKLSIKEVEDLIPDDFKDQLEIEVTGFQENFVIRITELICFNNISFKIGSSIDGDNGEYGYFEDLKNFKERFLFLISEYTGILRDHVEEKSCVFWNSDKEYLYRSVWRRTSFKYIE